jgi:hypothetical protein
MPKWKPAITQPIEVELGEADLRLEVGRDLYPIILSGIEYTGLEYASTQYSRFDLKHSGTQRSLTSELLAVVLGAAGIEHAGVTEQIRVGRASADYFIEDRVLVVNSGADPYDRPEAEQVELGALFDQFARRHYSDATSVYCVETALLSESVLHGLGYHLAFTVRRGANGRHHLHPLRIWTR